jgi:molybdopterin molybdotransferase
MATYDEARGLILDHITALGTEYVGILDALGRVVAEGIVAPWDMPGCDNSAMDGYAVRSQDCQQAVRLRITGYVAAGSTAPASLEEGCASKIMTGGPFPAGADSVVPFEDAEESDGRVWIKAPVREHQHIRFAGEDVRCGETVIRAGTVVRPPEISMLASCGRAVVPVVCRPRVAILSTGDELVELGELPRPGQVVNSNGISLAASVKECGAIPVMLGIARDTRASHLEKMMAGLGADVLLTSAGVSAGERDLVRETLAQLGMKPVFSRVEMGPGGPTCFGLRDRQPVFCLAGNPVASLIGFEEFVRPALLRMMGHRRVFRPLIGAVLQEDVHKKTGKLKFLRVRVEFAGGKRLAYVPGDQNTGILKTSLLANALALLPADRTEFCKGEEIGVHLLSGSAEMAEA